MQAAVVKADYEPDQPDNDMIQNDLWPFRCRAINTAVAVTDEDSVKFRVP